MQMVKRKFNVLVEEVERIEGEDDVHDERLATNDLISDSQEITVEIEVDEGSSEKDQLHQLKDELGKKMLNKTTKEKMHMTTQNNMD